MTNRIEQLTTELSQLESRRSAARAQFDIDNAHAVERTRTGDAAALRKSQQARALSQIEVADLTAAIEATQAELAAEQHRATNARAAECLPRLAELHARVPVLFARLEESVTKTVAAFHEIRQLEAEAATAVMRAAQILGLSSSELRFKMTVQQDLAVQHLQSALSGRPASGVSPRARLLGALAAGCYAVSDATGEDMPALVAPVEPDEVAE